MRPCLRCQTLTERSYCPACDPDRQRRRVTPGRTTKAQIEFRTSVLKNAGWRCEWVEDGIRCEATTGLEAHHITRLRDLLNFDPSDGVCLCRPHHRRADERAA